MKISSIISEECKNPMSSVYEPTIVLTSDTSEMTGTTSRQVLAGGLGHEIPAGVTTKIIKATIHAVGEAEVDEVSVLTTNMASVQLTVTSRDGSTIQTFDIPVNILKEKKKRNKFKYEFLRIFRRFLK